MKPAVWTWVLLAAAQTAPSAAQWDAVSPWGGTYPGERLLVLGAWAALAQWLYELDERRSPRVYSLMLAALAAALCTVPFGRVWHQPAMFAVQALAAAQLWQWAGHELTAAARTIAAIQTLAALALFPAVQITYGPDVVPGGAGSALFELAGPLPGLAIAGLGTLALRRALRLDASP